MNEMSPAAIAARLLDSMRRQASTTGEGRAIAAAGLAAELDRLLVCCVGNVANGLALDVEDAVANARAGA